MMIGRNQLPLAFFIQMHHSTAYYIQSPFSDRVDRLLREYSHFTMNQLITAIQLLEKRLGGNHCQEAVKACEANDFRTAIATVLKYYDKAYSKALIEKPYAHTITVASTTESFAVAHYLKTLIS
jgi:hypothetical protein